VVLSPHRAPPQLAQELSSLPVDLFRFRPSDAAKRPSKSETAEHRTRLWNDYLSYTVEVDIHLDLIPVLGTPPPRQAPDAWPGRQAALLDAAGGTIRMGEVIGLTEGVLTLRMPPGPEAALAAVLIRDAGRNAEGRLATVAQVGKTPKDRLVPAEMLPPATASGTSGGPVYLRVGTARAALVGGVFGDPLLHVRLRKLKRSYLFDLGDPGRLAAKVAHQVKAVFLSHAHIDHIGGFLWLLRSRIGQFGPCKIFGPPTTIGRINNFINAVTWDRIEENAPFFEVFEIFDTVLKGAVLRPGQKTIALAEQVIKAGIILEEERFNVSAIVCDHGVSSVAYALELQPEIRVQKSKLAASGWLAGPWLGRLKQSLAAGKPQEHIELPDKTVQRAGELAEKLITIRSGKKLVYAADMADTPENRKKVIALARSAHTLFCETAFTQSDKPRADANQHLTTLAAVEIARQSSVKQLVPFHFSKRYEHDPGSVYNEIIAAAGPIKVIGRY
jgi:ribonuclease Z